MATTVHSRRKTSWSWLLRHEGGLAAYLEVIRQLKGRGNLKGDTIVAGVVDEEHAMTGSIKFGKSGPSADYAIVGEPTSLAVASCHKGQINATIRTTGVTAHSSLPELGENAIMAMNRVLTRLERYPDMLACAAEHPICRRPRFSAYVIRGGTTASSAPDLCELEVDRRTIPGQTADSFYYELRGFLDMPVAGAHPLQYQLLPPQLNVAPLDVPTDSSLI